MRVGICVTTPTGIQQELCVITAIRWVIGHGIVQGVEVVVVVGVKAQVQGKVIRAQTLVGVSSRPLGIKER